MHSLFYLISFRYLPAVSFLILSFLVLLKATAVNNLSRKWNCLFINYEKSPSFRQLAEWMFAQHLGTVTHAYKKVTKTHNCETVLAVDRKVGRYISACGLSLLLLLFDKTSFRVCEDLFLKTLYNQRLDLRFGRHLMANKSQLWSTLASLRDRQYSFISVYSSLFLTSLHSPNDACHIWY